MKNIAILLFVFGTFMCLFPVLMGTPELLTLYAPVGIVNFFGGYWFWKKK
jgi:hypothetical protein